MRVLAVLMGCLSTDQCWATTWMSTAACWWSLLQFYGMVLILTRHFDMQWTAVVSYIAWRIVRVCTDRRLGQNFTTISCALLFISLCMMHVIMLFAASLCILTHSSASESFCFTLASKLLDSCSVSVPVLCVDSVVPVIPVQDWKCDGMGRYVMPSSPWPAQNQIAISFLRIAAPTRDAMHTLLSENVCDSVITRTVIFNSECTIN